MQLSDITVRVFMQCLFNKNYEGVGEEWADIYTQYIDKSGLGETRQLELVISIHNLQTRLSFITGWLEFQKNWVIQFGEPFIKGFDDIKQFGHRLIWEAGYPMQFLERLKLIESKEKRNYVEMEIQMRELETLVKTGKYKEKINERDEFVRMLNVLGKDGYKIDRDKTDMEELALMVRAHGEDIEALNKTN